MKILIGIVVASLMFANIGFAEMRLIEEKTIKDRDGGHSLSKLCVLIDISL